MTDNYLNYHGVTRASPSNLNAGTDSCPDNKMTLNFRNNKSGNISVYINDQNYIFPPGFTSHQICGETTYDVAGVVDLKTITTQTGVNQVYNVKSNGYIDGGDGPVTGPLIIGVLSVQGQTQAGQYTCANGGKADYCMNNAAKCYGDDRQYYATSDNGRCNGAGGGGGCTPNGCPMCLSLEPGDLKDCNYQFAPCPNLSSGAGLPTFKWADTSPTPFNGSTDNGNPAAMLVGCNYGLNGNTFTKEDVDKWLATSFVWTDARTQAATNTILGGADGSPSTGYCFQQVTNCPIDILTAKPMPICSRLISTTPGPCQSWAGKSGKFSSFVSQDIDDKMLAYCQANSTNGDCGCINRQQNSTYRLAKQAVGGVISDHCWYPPCSVQGSTSELIRTSDLAGDCPTIQQICQNVVEFINQQGASLNNQTIQNISQATNCTFTPAPPTPSPTPTPGPTPTPSPNPDTTKWYKKWWVILIGVILGLLLLLLIIWGFVKLGRKNTSTLPGVGTTVAG